MGMGMGWKRKGWVDGWMGGWLFYIFLLLGGGRGGDGDGDEMVEREGFGGLRGSISFSFLIFSHISISPSSPHLPSHPIPLPSPSPSPSSSSSPPGRGGD